MAAKSWITKNELKHIGRKHTEPMSARSRKTAEVCSLVPEHPQSAGKNQVQLLTYSKFVRLGKDIHEVTIPSLNLQ